MSIEDCFELEVWVHPKFPIFDGLNPLSLLSFKNTIPIVICTCSFFRQDIQYHKGQLISSSSCKQSFVRVKLNKPLGRKFSATVKQRSLPAKIELYHFGDYFNYFFGTNHPLCTYTYLDRQQSCPFPTV
jgi:hypothetical protein